MKPDPRYDRMGRGDGTSADTDRMDTTPSYDYKKQEWRSYSDHAHFLTDTSPLMFCGADGVTCTDGS